MSLYSEQKKKSTIVHKPFLTGQINIFNPPKANPNGRLASAKLLTKDRKKRPNNFFWEQVNSQTEDDLSSWQLDNPSSELINFPLRKTSLIAIAIIIIANILSAIFIFNQKFPQAIPDQASIKLSNSSEVGKIDLSAQEFMELKASNLSSVPQATTSQNLSLDSPSKTAPEKPEPLAIPPLNLQQNTNLAPPQIAAPYYYILGEYTGDRSLTLAREKFPHVSLVTLPEGVFIYMGAFRQKELAQTYIAQLKQEGLYAYIYPAD